MAANSRVCVSTLCLWLLVFIPVSFVCGYIQMGNPVYNAFHGALLLKNGQQTSCEFGLISNRHGYVAATCFEVDSELKAKDISKYEVMFDSSTDTPTPGRFGIANVTINPGFDPKSLANNVALVEFKSQSIKLWTSYIDRNPAEKSGHQFCRRTIIDMRAQKWSTPAGSDDQTKYHQCDDASPVYSANKGDFWVSGTSVGAEIEGLCLVAPGMAYGAVLDKIVAVSAIYSHSVTLTDTMCDSLLTHCHYYTLLYNYNAWAAQYVPEGIDLFSANPAATGSNLIHYSMKIPSSPYNSSVKTFSGDIYARVEHGNLWVKGGEMSADPTSLEISASTLSSDLHTTPSSSATELPTPTLLDSSSSSLSKSQVIAIAVAVPLATILIVIALFFGYKRWVKHRNTVTWDQSSEAHAIQAIALDSDNAGTHDEELPRYDLRELAEPTHAANEK